MPKKSVMGGSKGRPPTTTEPRVKRNFNFKKSVNDLLIAESKRTKKSANILVEEALKATIASETPLVMDVTGTSFSPPLVSMELAREIRKGVEDAVEHVLSARITGLSSEMMVLSSTPHVVNLPEKHRIPVEELAGKLGFKGIGHFLESLALGALSSPDTAKQLTFALHCESEALRTQNQIEEEDERQAPRLKIA